MAGQANGQASHNTMTSGQLDSAESLEPPGRKVSRFSDRGKPGL